MNNKIENKINELVRMIFEVEEPDVGILMTFITELKILEAYFADARTEKPKFETSKQVISDSTDYVVRQINAKTDPKLVFKTLSACISNLQEIFVNGKDPQTLRFPFSLGAEGQNAPGAVEIDASLISDFIEKLKGDTAELEVMTLKIESSEDGATVLAAIKRLVHTLKGESGVLNLVDMQIVLHELETFLEGDNRAGVVDKLLQVKDWLVQKAAQMAGNAAAELEAPDKLVARLFTEPVKAKPAATAPVAAEKVYKKASDPAVYLYSPDSDHSVPMDDHEFIREFLTEAGEHLDNVDQAVLTLEKNPLDKDAINIVFRAYHTIKGISGMLDFEDVKNTAHAAENILDMARQDKLVVGPHVIDLIFESTDKLRNYADEIHKSLDANSPFYRDKNVQVLIRKIKEFLASETGAGAETSPVPQAAAVQTHVNWDDPVPAKPAEAVSAAQHSEKPAPAGNQDFAFAPHVSAPLSDLNTSPPADPTAVSEKHTVVELSSGTHKAAVKVKELIKVDTEVLDKILNTIGELVIAESMVQRNFLDGETDTDLADSNVRQLEKITRELQELGMSLRMTSLKTTFEKMARLVRDVAKKTGKLVSFVMEGEDTELDRNVVERISDPLIHMIRNAVDHGIEATVEDRVKAGKKPSGSVMLKAYHQGGNVHIEIRDDGKGLDRDAILRKGREKGLISDESKMSEEEIFNLVFMPGFSTAAKVTDVSGRGVGMDVVKKNIESLRGRIAIRSTKGNGSVFTIILPLTLAIIDGMIIKVGEDKYIIPTLNISESIKLSPAQLNYAMGMHESVLIRDQLVPVYRLHKMFRMAAENQKGGLLVVVENGGKQVGLVVDEIIGQQQIVIKNLGTLFRDLKGFSGGAIMADGSVGLILDIASLIAITQDSEASEFGGALEAGMVQ